MLQEGGNAIDAAVTTALCQGIFNPMASGAGGGGFITILMPNGSAEVIDAREIAPAAANETMYKGAYAVQSVSTSGSWWTTSLVDDILAH